MTLVDTHCHLDFHKFDSDRAEVLERAARAGVERILIPGLTLTSSLSAVKLAESHPRLFAAIGIHPTESSNVECQTFDVRRSTFDKFRNLAQNPKVKAIGEIGLDYYWDTAPHDVQRRVLEEQLDLAAELSLPVVIHMREKGDAEDGECATDLLKILEDWAGRLRVRNEPLAERPGVLHSFSGSLETARQAIRLNFYIGVTGPVTFQNARKRQSIIAELPLKSMLIETDAPFLAPHPHRGRRNEPAYAALVAGKIAELHSTPAEETAAVTTANAARLFRW